MSKMKVTQFLTSSLHPSAPQPRCQTLLAKLCDIMYSQTSAQDSRESSGALENKNMHEYGVLALHRLLELRSPVRHTSPYTHTTEAT